jgi:DNA (cytosine-5)-methyltransferase 1
MRFLSVCSGIEAASVAWGKVGMHAVAFAEVEPFPSAVLAHHYPNVPNLGDMTKIDGTKYRGVDVVVGGTPCQAFSIAGLRQGLADARGNLSLKFVELCNDADPDYVVWENVPGVLSSKDNAFGCFISGLAGGDAPAEPGPRPAAGKNGKFWRWDKVLGTHVPKWSAAGHVVGPKRIVAWRCLDAQFFDLAQRRLRVFVVACPRNGSDPQEILFEREGVRWNPEKSRKTRKGVAARSAGGSGGAIVRSLALRGRDGGGSIEVGDDVGFTLRASSGGGDKPHVFAPAPQYSFVSDIAPTIPSRTTAGGGMGTDFDLDGGLVSQVLAFGGNNTSGPIDVATAVSVHGGSCGRMDFESETFVAQPVFPILEVGARTGASTSDPRAGIGIGDDGDPMFTLQAGKQHGVATAYRTSGNCGAWETGDRVDALTTGTDPYSHLVGQPTAFSCKDYGADAGPIAPTLRAMGHSDSHANAGGQLAVCITGDITHTLNTANNGKGCSEDGTGRGVPTISIGHIVRRLTPVECARLQGFPDNHTNIIYRGKPAADGPQYKAIGNSMATNVMAWIGLRLVEDHWRRRIAAHRARVTAT